MARSLRLQLLPALFLLSTLTSAQEASDVVRRWLAQEHARSGLTARDAVEWQVTSRSTDRKGVTYVYIEQTAHGLPVHNAVASFAVLEGKVVSFGNRLRSDVHGRSGAATPALTAVEAYRSAAKHLLLPISSTQVVRTNSPTDLVLSGAGISHDPIPARLLYEALPDGRIRLAWDLTIRSITTDNWWHLAVDAHDGSILRQVDYVTHCAHPTAAPAYRALDDLAAAPAPLAPPPPDGSGYRVFPFPTESPSHGPHTLVMDPSDPVASPFGWHDVNGAAGAEYTTTRGNNVYAWEDLDNDDEPGYSPSGGAGLQFDFPYVPPQAPADYLDAAITNLFYTCNVLHDVWYHYGFDEESGNFQAHNANGLGASGDEVMAQAQDGGGMNNANFATPPDGSHGYMQMYLWRTSTDSTLLIDSPESIAGNYLNSLAGFGPELPSEPISSDLILVEDDTAPVNDGCDNLLNASAIDGHIALVDRGQCTFVNKVLALQAAGATAVIVINNVGGDPIAMGGSEGQEGIVIPSVMISLSDGNTIKQALEDGPVHGTLMGVDNADLRDSDFDNGIIAHEYGHGVSTRLTGGPANSDCLWNAEQMGEGWSDWMGLMLTQRADDGPSDVRGVGTFVRNQAVDGDGIRPAPYSTDFAVNDYTYGNTNSQALTEPHGIGFVWATMLWDLNWALIEEHGYDPDLYNGTGGNNIAIQLMMDGLKLQPCNPGFVDGRDAILRADTIAYGAQHACLIWETFARRGLGYSADQGSSFDRTDQVEAFDVPAACISTGITDAGTTDPIGFTLMPNPTEEAVTISLGKPLDAPAFVRVHAADGRLVRNVGMGRGARSLVLDVTGLAPALYVVELHCGDRTWKQRLVVR
ncbi:MAG TPA: T9SS-dependent M36 family metallopeptidase [Flavobacteriales bacterium]